MYKACASQASIIAHGNQFSPTCTLRDTNYHPVPILSSITFVRLNGSFGYFYRILRILCQVWHNCPFPLSCYNDTDIYHEPALVVHNRDCEKNLANRTKMRLHFTILLTFKTAEILACISIQVILAIPMILEPKANTCEKL